MNIEKRNTDISWVKELKNIIPKIQFKASIAVNRELLELFGV